MFRRTVEISFALLLVLFFIPLFCVEPVGETSEGGLYIHSAEASDTAIVFPGTDESVSLTVELAGEVQTMTLREYITAVVRAEMPADFSIEALKAQAVAARSYTLYQLSHAAQCKHASGAALCGDSTCCQAYVSEEKARKNWNAEAEEKLKKTADAVIDTDGVVALYEGEPILAAFHSSAAGATEDAALAWSASVPYLKSVASPETAATVPRYETESRFSAGEFRTLFLAAHPEASFPNAAEDYVRKLQRDEAGYVDTCEIGGVRVRGVEVRRIFSLRSACFTVTAKDDELVFLTEGYGHGVGMSQYGAELMAQQGESYENILKHYYAGIELGQYTH